MGALLAVAPGLGQPARGDRVASTRGRGRASRTICLWSAGNHFPYSGGIFAQDPPAMDEMKFYMSGAATVLCGDAHRRRTAIAHQPLFIVAAAENCRAAGGRQAGDLVTTMSGSDRWNAQPGRRRVPPWNCADALHLQRPTLHPRRHRRRDFDGACIIRARPSFHGCC